MHQCLVHIRIRFSQQFHCINTSQTILGSFSKCLKNLVQFSSVTQSCPTLCDPMNRSMPGFLVHHQLLEFTQTHVHWVGDAIQPSHPVFSPSPPAPNPSQHQSFPMSQLFARGGQSIAVSVLPMNTQDWSPLGWTGWISLQSKGLSRVIGNWIIYWDLRNVNSNGHKTLSKLNLLKYI